jgi:hypothetical protein
MSTGFAEIIDRAKQRSAKAAGTEGLIKIEDPLYSGYQAISGWMIEETEIEGKVEFKIKPHNTRITPEGELLDNILESHKHQIELHDGKSQVERDKITFMIFETQEVAIQSLKDCMNCTPSNIKIVNFDELLLASA